MRTLIQCDFDGTITEADLSFQLLDAFGDGDWRRLLAEYRENKISIGCFNTTAFARLKADRQTLIEFVQSEVTLRAGFHELLGYCRENGFQFVIVSNGLDFYIDVTLRDMGMENIEVFAAQTRFVPGGLQVKYVGPTGHQLDNSFKETYTRLFLKRGYRIVYVGNGLSDIPAAGLAAHVFARDELLTYCRDAKLNYTPFINLNDVVSGLEILSFQ